MRFPTAIVRAPAIDAWMRQHPDEPGEIARHGFEIIRGSGDDVRARVSTADVAGAFLQATSACATAMAAARVMPWGQAVAYVRSL